jgi:large subunit ribosomal protein L10
VEFSGEAAEKVSIRGGVLEGRPLDAGAVKELAELPPREVLVGTLLGLIQAPAAQLLRTIQEPGARLVRLLDRLRSGMSGQ